jgi:hypothetical protein
MNRTFTPDEANSALAQVRPLAERMVALRARLAELEGEQREVTRVVAGNGRGDAVGDAQARELREVAGELALIGVHVKDPDTGLVDFSSRRGDEEVLLCWRVGEPSVEWWHTPEEGFQGRRRIDW